MPPLASLFDRWAHEPGQPRLTWYGPDSERVELTGRVLNTWVAKAANLLAEEADAHPGSTVRLDLPAHWRAAVWALAAWACGATVVLGEGPAEVLVTAEAVSPEGEETVIVIALPALAMAVENVPPGSVDGAAEAMSQPDVLIQPATSPAALLRHDGGERDLIQASDVTGERALLRVATPEASGPVELAQALASMMGAWVSGGSVVLVADPEADDARIAAQESARPVR